jgi:PhoH-like ATPase
MKKTYVVDTNVLLSDPTAIFAFEDNDIIIPMIVLEELDRHKNRSDEVGRNARQVNRTLDDMRRPGESLSVGVKLPGGGLLRVLHLQQLDGLKQLPQEFEAEKADNFIIALMLNIHPRVVGDCILVSKDINVRVKCDALGIRCQDYLKLRIVDNPDKFYRGVQVVEVAEDVVDAFYQTGKLQLPEHALLQHDWFPNQIIIVKAVHDDGHTIKSALTKCVDPTKPFVPVTKIDQAFGLVPRNKEQTFSLDLLFDDNIKLVTLTGLAGCGKTLLSLAAGLAQLRGLGDPAVAKYDKLIVSRPIQPLGKDIGFLPGTLEEKMDPWIAPIRDNLNFLMDSRRNRPKRKRQVNSGDKQQSDDNVYLRLMQERGLIEIEAITYIRGRSIPNAFIVIDEAQNLSVHELKTIITRAGDGTKIILTGDLSQIDNVHVDVFTNGLSYAIEKFKTEPIAGHVTLLKGERSPLASLASEIL